MTGTRHRWGEPARFPHKTERTCIRGCGTTKVTRFEAEGAGAVHWTEFWRNGDQIQTDRTPPCEPFVASCVQLPATTSETS